MTALGVAAMEHAVPELGGAEVTEHEPPSGVEVDRSATEHVDVRRAVCRKAVAARMTLGE